MTNSPASEYPLASSLERMREGDVDAFEAVVRHFSRPLRAWLAVQAPPGVDADEIAQRSFIAAFQRIREFQPGPDSSFSAWLFSIARWQLKTEATRLRRVADYHSRYAPDLLQKLHPEPEPQPEQLMTRLEHLRLCVQGLGDAVSRFIHWRYHDQISLEEMAKLSGRSVPAVKKQLWLLRRKLQECLEQRMAGAANGGHTA